MKRFSSLITVLCTLFLALSVAQWRGCGDACVNSNKCDDALCSYCDLSNTGKCLSGRGCNSSCTVDSDCERLRYCYLCTFGVCSPGPLYPFQCTNCNTDTDCKQSGCGHCVADLSHNNKICSAGCGGSCQHNYECGYGTKCSRCDPISNTCQSGNVCGSRCGNNGDCDQTSTCKLCIDYICSVPCGQPCKSSSECNAPVTGCGVCKGGVCTAGVTCGSICVYDRDCQPAASDGCAVCVNGVCAKKGCNSTCSTNADCGTAGECRSCTNGQCTAPQCGSQCQFNEDCGTVGTCLSCLDGSCNVTQCGSFCRSNIECGAAGPGCQECVNNRCGHRVCGDSCQIDSDCNNAGVCTSCHNGFCTKPIPPDQCDLNKPCEAGNNNQCPQDTCSRCDPFTNTCRLGGPCGAACIVNTDCDQTGNCTLCRNICVDLPAALQIDKNQALEAKQADKPQKYKIRSN
eukprot:TRINITY_DN118_c0_g2_i1.p1 TRINITY_DN118_c0_g2~~TRINITY_DN118_c0_g2_i1.p1  ORF type:complete len:457 (-),score=52.66 TRINITY_DN118_c0_g2_i1:31-1401(-)